MSDDLVKRLRINIPFEAPRCLEAADRIEAQAAEIERLKFLNDLNAVPAGIIEDRGRMEERAKIVAWLYEAGYRQIANGIEEGEHLK